MDDTSQLPPVESSTTASVSKPITPQHNSSKRILIKAGIIVTVLLVGAAYYLNLSKVEKALKTDNDTSLTPVKEVVETESGYRTTNISGFEIPFKEVPITELFDISNNYTIPQSKIGIQQSDLIQISCTDNYFLNESNEPVVRDDVGNTIVSASDDINKMFLALKRDISELKLDIPFDSPYLIICKTNENKYFGRFDSYYNKSLPFFILDSEYNIKWIVPNKNQNISNLNKEKNLLGDVPKLCNYMLGLTASNDLFYMCGGSDAQYASMNLYVINLDNSIFRFIIHCSIQGDGSFENPKTTTNCSNKEV